jgi:predicted membrane protein
MNVNLLLAAVAIWVVEATVIWLVGPRPRRFSLRTLLIAMTVASLLLGLIAVAS